MKHLFLILFLMVGAFCFGQETDKEKTIVDSFDELDDAEKVKMLMEAYQLSGKDMKKDFAKMYKKLPAEKQAKLKEKNEQIVQAKVRAEMNRNKSVMKGEGKVASTVPLPDRTSISFETPSFDFGTITQGEAVQYVYKFTNTGDKPLIISKAKGSCGCTVPVWPKKPIAPGETGELKVEFNSKGKMGKQHKSITVTSNTDPAITNLAIKGEVVLPPKNTGIKVVPSKQ